MVRLYKIDISPPARACMIACKLFKVPVEYVEVNIVEGEQLKPEFLRLNPLHTVPVLQDDSLVIHESHSIVKYLADVYSKEDSVYPKDPRQRALVDQKLFFDASILFPRLWNIMYPLIYEGVKVIPQRNLDAIEDAYHLVEEFLSRTKYIAGNNITIADIVSYPTITGLIMILDLNVQKYPKMNAWRKELEKLPHFAINAYGQKQYKKLYDSRRA